MRLLNIQEVCDQGLPWKFSLFIFRSVVCLQIGLEKGFRMSSFMKMEILVSHKMEKFVLKLSRFCHNNRHSRVECWPTVFDLEYGS